MKKTPSTICYFLCWPPVDRTEWAVERGIVTLEKQEVQRPVQSRSVKV
jgi:hypothetical protein